MNVVVYDEEYVQIYIGIYGRTSAAAYIGGHYCTPICISEADRKGRKQEKSRKRGKDVERKGRKQDKSRKRGKDVERKEVTVNASLG